MLFYPNTIKSFLKLYNFLIINKYDLNKLVIIGNGSNVLASDKLFNGVVVCLKKIKDRIRIIKSESNYKIIECYSGVLCNKLSNYLKDNNLTGGEELSTIPGTIGGVVTMNASCYDFVTSDHVKEVLVLDNGLIRWLNKDELEFNYRSSKIMKSKIIVLKVRFCFYNGDNKKIENKIKELKLKRQLSQPLKEHNAGSVFKNINNVKAWKLIEECKLKGFKYKNAEVSQKHANFIINKGDSGDDIYVLMQIIKKIVKKLKNYDLESEWVLINF